MMSKSYRIDWFDGSVAEDRRPTTSTADRPRTQPSQNKEEKKAIGFHKLFELSQLEPPILNLELESRPGFWLLFSSDLSDDFMVLIIKTLKTLYKSLKKSDSFKLLQLLETKFMESDFFDKLYEYVKKLPDVRLSQKSRNSQLWNDANCFYSDLVQLYWGIFKFYNNRKEYLEKLNGVVEITDVSALGVEGNHSESISRTFYQHISDIQMDLRKTLKPSNPPQINKPGPSVEINKETLSAVVNDPLYLDEGNTHYKDLSIVPDLLSIDLNTVNSIKPNIIDGVYASVEHYLDIQFKLLREDCYRTLKEGINHYRKYKTLKNCKDVAIRVYRKVFIVDIKVAMNRVGYVVELRQPEDLKAYGRAKKFMHGSLLFFTTDNFKSAFGGTVITTEDNNNLIVEFDGTLPVGFFHLEYVMAESEVYFEPYHKVLKVLQRATPPIPMQRYIVHVDKQILPPAYLAPNTTYCYEVCGGNKQFPVFYPVWPPARDFGLDESQMEAFRFALTREFVVIQGPPGTGKTYLSTKIAGTLLKNISFSGSPMLVICLTNHALDQFLEGLLKFTNAIVRVGGQSKSEILQDYNFKHLKNPKAYTRMYYQKRKELDGCLHQLKELMAEMKSYYNNTIVNYETLKRHYLGDPHRYPGCGVLFRTPADFENYDFIYWLLGTELSEDCKNVTPCSLNYTAANKIVELKKEIEQLKQFNCGLTQCIVDLKKCDIRVLETTINAVEEMMTWFKHNRNSTQTVPNVSDIFELDRTSRWYLYFMAVSSMERRLLLKKDKLYSYYLNKTKELEELRDTMDCVKLSATRVVGLTTTMAAARHGLLTKLKPFVVIVEEAAEVLESHIVASLTDKCQHLIMIGDHKQLRPNSAHYEIGKKYDLEVSLFERMVRNGVHSKTLTIQRRMRPEIRDLLVPTIYEKLDCHPSVFDYPNIRGMTKNLYFFDHTNFEETEGNGSSYMNKFEAEWCLSLANYLVNLKYKPAEVTILATYSAQVALIIKLRKCYSLIQKVHVTTVDNYQGEENRIVILSLVRSNKEKNVGFLATENRVCVALSRAKEGLYIFGNMSCLETSAMWRSMKTKLRAQSAIGRKFDLIINNTTQEVGTTTELDDLCKTISRLYL